MTLTLLTLTVIWFSLHGLDFTKYNAVGYLQSRLTMKCNNRISIITDSWKVTDTDQNVIGRKNSSQFRH